MNVLDFIGVKTKAIKNATSNFMNAEEIVYVD